MGFPPLNLHPRSVLLLNVLRGPWFACLLADRLSDPRPPAGAARGSHLPSQHYEGRTETYVLQSWLPRAGCDHSQAASSLMSWERDAQRQRQRDLSPGGYRLAA